MRYVPTILLVLALPAGLLGYAIGLGVTSALPLPGDARGLVGLFIPLLIAGLFMLPFLVPFVDRKAKQDLAAHRRLQERSVAPGDHDQPE
jgi:hypothetical protein